MNAGKHTTTVIDGLAFPEAPRWHNGALWFSDFYTQEAHRLNPGGQTRIVADDRPFPNGCVITPDRNTLVVAESFGRQLTAFDIGVGSSLHDRRIWAALSEASPDGICIDAEGAIWVASPPTSEFLRVREGGEITDRIGVRNQAIACALDGADRRTYTW